MTEKQASRGWFRVGEIPTTRIQAFSDGVFSVAVTLLVLEIHVPQLPQGPTLSAALMIALLAQIPKFLVYALSFTIICVWWVAHHQLFHILRKSDRGLIWLNNFYLLWLALIPFPTALMGDYPHEKAAVMTYGIVSMLAGVSFTMMRYYAFYVGKLVDERIDGKLLRSAMAKSFMNPLLHCVAVLMALVDTRIAITLYVILTLLFFIPSDLEKHVHAAGHEK